MLSLQCSWPLRFGVSGKRGRRGGVSASLLSRQSVKEVLPSVVLEVDGVLRRVLVDTGCSRSVAHVSWCKTWTKSAVCLVTASGDKWQCEGTGTSQFQLHSGARADISVCVTTEMPLGFSFILGMDGINALGGVTVDPQGRVCFGVEDCICAATDVKLKVDQPDFTAAYDPSANCWTAAWRWAEGKEPGVLQYQVTEYAVPQDARDLYEKELQRWINDGWLLLYDKQAYRPAKGLKPLMAVAQHNKRKVHPVMDFRELNTYIDTFTADSDV